jgi:hypothetical protein
MKTWMESNAWIVTAFAITGLSTVLGLIGTWAVRKLLYKREDNASVSKIERESKKINVEQYLVELNVQEIINKKAEAIEDKYKDVIFNMQREHFEIKKDIQGRLEKEMKARIEAEQENEILKNELNIIKEKSEDQDKQIDELRREVNKLKAKS